MLALGGPYHSLCPRRAGRVDTTRAPNCTASVKNWYRVHNLPFSWVRFFQHTKGRIDMDLNLPWTCRGPLSNWGLESNSVDQRHDTNATRIFFPRSLNISVKVCKASKKLFSERDILLTDWQARSPGLNPIANLWRILARRVYSRRRQFGSVPELEVGSC